MSGSWNRALQWDRRHWWWCATMVWILALAVAVEACVPSCQCTMVGTKKKQKGRRVECSKHPAPFTSLAHIPFPPDTVQLDLSGNKLSVLKERSFIGLSMLKKLNISSNMIAIIEPGAFEGLQNLRELDLTGNKIGTVNSSMFTGLPKLDRLWLTNNFINTIPDGTFNDLTGLHKIDFGSSYLRCDCHLRWVVQWAVSKKVKLSHTTVCALPSSMQGRVLRKLTADQLHCEHDFQLPVFEIKPSHSQLVFEGDKLPFECRASFIHPGTEIAWMRQSSNEVIVSNKSAGVFVHTSYSPDMTIMSHSLVVESLDKTHQGVWSCQVSTPQGQLIKHVEVEVLSYGSLSCPRVVQVTPKGKYIFEMMVAGVRAKQPCQAGGPDKFVSYLCDSHGIWRDLNASACAFTSDRTRNLEKLAQEEVNATDVGVYLQRLRQVIFTSKHKQMVDLSSIDVHYLASILQDRLLPFSYTSGQVMETLLGLCSNLSALSATVLMQAQIDSRATKRVLDVLQNFTANVVIDPPVRDWSFSSKNIAVVVLRDIPLTASRVHCSLRRSQHDSQAWFTNRVLSCSRLGNNSENRHLWSENTDLSIDVPSTLLQDAGMIDENSTGIFITVFRKGRLFRSLASKHSDPRLAKGNWTVVSSVVSVSVGHPVPNLTEPVVLVLRNHNSDSSPVTVAYWDFSANDGLGDWRTDGCEIVERKGNHTVVHVYHLSYFAIILDVSEKPARLLMDPVLYVGSGVCIICMLLVLITYISCFRVILTPKKMKHSLINICLALVLLLMAFVLGINRTDAQVPCQVTGICLHYLTLSATFWITITSNNMYKKFTKADQPPSPPPEPVAMPLPPKPILRFYFLGWGVPIIICGITAAVNLDHYLGTEYCFLAWEPSLGAFYAPMGLLVIFNLIFFMRISCIVRVSATSSLNDSDETEEVHTNEIELVPSQADTNLDVQSVANEVDNNSRRSRISGVGVSTTRKSATSSNGRGGGDVNDDEEEDDGASTCSLPDAERRPITQLRALVATLFLFIVMWVCGAFAVARPFMGIIPYQKLIFSYLYGLASTLFGVFMLTYFCLTRQDSRSVWKRYLGFGPPATYTGPVSTEPVTQAGETPTPPTQPNGTVVKSNSNLDISTYSQKSSNITKACNIKNNMNKQANNSIINLVSVPTSSLTEVSYGSIQEGYPNFYNPRQNGAARKFWQKNRQHKVMNKDVNKDINASLTDNMSPAEISRCLTRGIGGDPNAHLSIEIQFQAKESARNFSIAGYDPASSNSNLIRHNHTTNPNSSQPHQLINNNTTTAALISAHAHCPLGYQSDGGVHGRSNHSPSPCRSHTSPSGSQHFGPALQSVQQQQPQLPQHQRTASSGSNTAHPSAFTPVLPRNSTLPRQGKSESDPANTIPSESLVTAENCGVFGDAAGLGISQYPGFESCLHSVYLPPVTCNVPVSHAYGHPYSHPQVLARSISPVVSGMIPGFMYMQRPVRSPAQSNHTQPLSGDSSDASSRHHHHSRYSSHSSSYNYANQSSGVGGGGGGVVDGSKSPVMSDVTATPSSYDGHMTVQDPDSQTQAQKVCSIDSEHHSDPTHRKKHRSYDRYGHHRRGLGVMTKQRSLGWEEQFKGRPHKVAYAYVNHNYRDKVMQKLIKQASESDELAKKAFWLPRSLSEYDRLTQMGFCNMAEDTSTSSDGDDSFDNVWLPQKDNSELFKKETSV